MLGIIDRVENGEIDLLSSETLQLETEKNPNPLRRRFALEVLGLATRDLEVTEQIESRARTYEGAGVRPFDALHLASAVVAEADMFCTTDDDLYRIGQDVDTKQTRVLTPVELIEVIES